jgi:hypothetical protein
MSQNIINVGEVANDGTGESLRDAFNAVNDNFSQIWASGPVNTNVVIANNVITTAVTNQNLILSPKDSSIFFISDSTSSKLSSSNQ